jgi:hypothetical protein
MFPRFRETPYGLQVSLIQNRREGGKVRHEHIAGLGAITVPTSAADRIAFWRHLHDRLSALSLCEKPRHYKLVRPDAERSSRESRTQSIGRRSAQGRG